MQRVDQHNDAVALLGQLFGKKNIYVYPEPSRKTTLFNEASEQHIDIRDTDRRLGPVLGAYWDAVAETIVAKSAAIVKARKPA